MAHDQLKGLSGIELVTSTSPSFKEIGAELEGRDVDPAATDALIVAYRNERLPAWLVAYLLGCARAAQGYELAREILVAAPRLLAESYAGPAMAKIAGEAAYDDLVSLMLGASHLRSREGAAYGLGVLQRPGTAAVMLQAVQTGRVRRHTAAFIVARLPDAISSVLAWLSSDDDVADAMALDAAHGLLVSTDGAPDVALAWAIRKSLDAGRVKLSPRMREQLLKRLAPVT